MVSRETDATGLNGTEWNGMEWNEMPRFVETIE